MSDITPLLLDAKKEYTSRLEEIVTPQLRATFSALYAECMEEGGDVYMCFQGKMREIPFWNSNIVQQKTQQLITSYSFFENLVVAVIVTYVKVLSAIRLGDGRPSVKLKVPRTDEFVHEIYKQMAMICYYEPFIVESRDTFESQAIPEAIERSIRRLIPYDEILDSYLAPEEDNEAIETPKDAVSSDSESDIESEDDDDEDINVSVPSAQVQTHVPQPPAAVPADQPVVIPSALQDHGGDLSDDDDLPPSCPPYPSPPSNPQYAVQQPAPSPPVQHQQAYAAPPQQVSAPPQAVAPPPAAAPQQLFGQDIRQTM